MQTQTKMFSGSVLLLPADGGGSYPTCLLPLDESPGGCQLFDSFDNLLEVLQRIGVPADKLPARGFTKDLIIDLNVPVRVLRNSGFS